MKNNFPDKVWIHANNGVHVTISPINSETITSLIEEHEYHHTRIVEALRKENEELKADINLLNLSIDIYKNSSRGLVKENRELKAKLEANEKLMDESADKLIKANAEIQGAFEAMKAKLDKAKAGLRFYASKDFASDAVSLNRAQYDNGQRARTTLEEM